MAMDTIFSGERGDARPLIAHVVYRFDVGGLENGVVNLLNRLPQERFRHAVIALTDVTDFRQRVIRDDVTFIELHKSPGHGVKLFPRLYRLFQRLQPTIVHTRNLAALEATIPAWCAGVRIRIHGEHGRDIGDLDGSNWTYRMLRRVHRPFVTHYVAVSTDLERYLAEAIGVRPARITHIVNGVDTGSFFPVDDRLPLDGCPFNDSSLLLIGAVGRLQPVKNQTMLARAFVRALEIAPDLRARLRLVIVGAGPLRPEILDILAQAGAAELAWLPGARNDIADVLRSLAVFVLPSLAEGISNTLLEAMATGLPVVATRVGGTPELVDENQTGVLVAADDVDGLARALLRYGDPEAAHAAGRAGRRRVERLYSLDAMVARYSALYESLLLSRRGTPVPAAGTSPGDRVTTGSH